MVSSRKKGQSNRRLFSQTVGFDQDFIIGNGANGRQQSIVVNEDIVDQGFTVNHNSSNATAN